MRAIEFESLTNNQGNLEINYPLNTVNKSVRVIAFIEEDREIEEKLWFKSILKNPSFDFLKTEEEIYSLNDGTPINHEK